MLFTEKLDDKESYFSDTYHMGECLESFPKQCSDALFLSRELTEYAFDFNHIILCGMGGSALAGEFVKDVCGFYGHLPIFVHKNYGLPPFANRKSLVILLSYSGNTEETVSSYQRAKEIGCNTLCVSSGGQLIEDCENAETPFLLLPGGFQPRMATFLMALPLISWLTENHRCEIPSGAFGELYFHLLALKEKWGTESPAINNRAKVMAFQFYNRTPLILGSQNLSEMASINMRNQLNETAKSVAYCSVLPELNHNEMMMFQNYRKEVGVLAIRNPYESPRLKKRFDITRMLLEEKVGCYKEFTPAPLSYLTTLGESIYFGDWIAYYLSILKEENPKEIQEIEVFKARMAR